MGNTLQKYQWIIIAVLLLFGMQEQFTTLLSSNDIWLMICAKRWLAGGTYYHDFVENNPPLIIYLSTIPVLISKAFSIDNQTAMRIFIFSMSTIILLFSHSLLNRIFGETEKTKTAILTILLAFVFWNLPVSTFGEREHISVILIMPYLLLLTLRCENKVIPHYLAIAAGFLGAIGFGLKPHFLIALFLIELYGLCITKKYRILFRAECITLCTTLIAYFISIFYLTPTYMHDIFPMVVHFYLGFEKEPLVHLVAQIPLIPTYIALLLPFLIFRQLKGCHLHWIWYLTLAGYFAAYLLQRKTWSYHALPLFSYSILVIGLIALLFKKSQTTSAKNYTVYLCLFLAFISIFSPSYIGKTRPKKTRHSKLQLSADIQKYDQNQPVYIFTTELADFAQVFLVHGKISPRFPAFWMLPGLLNCLSQGENAACYPHAIKTKKYLLSAVAEDFEKYRPGLVLIQQSDRPRYLYEPPYLTIQKFNYSDFFSENPSFKVIWSHYHYLKTENGYKLYVRTSQ